MASDSELAIILSLRDEASAALKKAGQQVSGFASAMTTASGHASSFNNSIRSVITTAAGFTLAQVGIAGIGGAFNAVKTASFGMNVEMENTRARLVAFTKDGATADAILKQIRTEADKTPFAFNQMASATAGLMSSAKMAGEPLMDLVKTAEILAASNPAQGLDGAAFALREAVSGDFVSIIDRFDLPRWYINQLKEEGLPNLEIVRKAMLAVGYDADLVGNLALTADGKWSTLMDTLSGLASKISQPIFDRFKIGLDKAQGAAGTDAMTTWAENTAAAIDVVLDALGTMGPVFMDTFGSIFDIVSTIGRGIYEAMSWLNPLATHSPSLVSQVQDGTAQIKSAYNTTGVSVANTLNATSNNVNQLNNNLAKTGTAANGAKTALESYKKQVSDIKTQLDAAKSAMQNFASAPLAGSEAWDQRIWEKQQIVDQAELEMLKLQHSGFGQDKMQPQYEQLKQWRDSNAELQRMLELQKKLEQAPTLRSIELAKPYKELTGDEILKGMAKNRAIIADLQPQYDAMSGVLKDMEEAAKGAGSAIGGLGASQSDLNKTFGDAKQQIEDAKTKYAELKTEWETNLKPGLENLNLNATKFSTWIKENKQPIIEAFAAFSAAVVGVAIGTALINPVNALLVAVGLLSTAWMTDFMDMRTTTEKLGNLIKDMLADIKEFIRLLGGIPEEKTHMGNQPGDTMGGGTPSQPGKGSHRQPDPPDMGGQSNGGLTIVQNFYGYSPNQVGSTAKNGVLNVARSMGM